MQDKTLLKIALILSLIGITVLYIISVNIEITETQISDLDENELGSTVKIKGTIESISEKENLIIINVAKREILPIMIFKNNKNSTVNFEKNQRIEIIGQLKEYNNELEIIADSIKTI